MRANRRLLAKSHTPQIGDHFIGPRFAPINRLFAAFNVQEIEGAEVIIHTAKNIQFHALNIDDETVIELEIEVLGEGRKAPHAHSLNSDTVVPSRKRQKR